MGFWNWLKNAIVDWLQRNKRRVLDFIDEQFDAWIDWVVAEFYNRKPEMRQHSWIIEQLVKFAKDHNNRLVDWIWNKILG